MKNTKIIALILMLTFAATMATLPTIFAHDPPWTVPTWSYVTASPNPIGVNQQTVVVFWPDKYPPTAVGAYGDRWTWNIEITKPDSSKETLGPFTSDPVGGGWTLYTPTEVGTYTIVATMDEHTVTGEPFPPGTQGLYRGVASVNDTYLSSTSDPFILTVQEDPIEAWQETSLPTQYWERPINSMNRNWWQIAGNWLAGSAQNVGPTSNFGYGTGPESAHIMWATPMWAGGIMDARFGNIGYQTSHYEGLSLTPPVILNGKIYYNVESIPREGYRVLDLYTGEELWYANQSGTIVQQEGTQQLSGNVFDYTGRLAGVYINFGQIYNYESPNQHGGFPYLWMANPPGYMASPTDTWKMFDAETGAYICSITNMTSTGATRGTNVYGKDGSILYYNLDTVNNRLTCWNTSRVIWYREKYQTNQYWMWRPYLNYTFGAQYGFSINVSIPDVQGRMLAIRDREFIIGGTSGTNNEDGVIPGTMWALSLEPGDEGRLLWSYEFTPPSSAANLTISMGTVDPEDAVFLFESTQTRQRWGYDLDTGQMLWGPTNSESPYNYYGMSDVIYQGKLFSFGYGGEIVAYNIRTGDVEWVYTATGVGFESPYGNYPLSLACVADGKLYMYSTEHSPTQPLWRGSYLRCIDVETGGELWKISHWGGGTAIADGYIVSLNHYDNRIYCYGKGETETTVAGPENVQSLGSKVLITGTIMDQSPGAKGTPAIADEYMIEWMEYLYMQQECPTFVDGVAVVLTTLDPNGNTYELGRTVSSASGAFGCEIEPPVPGLYKIIATFEGSDSYYGSYAETYISVREGASPGQQLLPEIISATQAAEMPYIATEAVTIMAIAIIAVIVLAGFYIFRKQE